MYNKFKRSITESVIKLSLDISLIDYNNRKANFIEMDSDSYRECEFPSKIAGIDVIENKALLKEIVVGLRKESIYLEKRMKI